MLRLGESGTSYYVFDLIKVTVHVEAQKSQSWSDIKRTRKKMWKYRVF
jgi:hypothetical protein